MRPGAERNAGRGDAVGPPGCTTTAPEEDEGVDAGEFKAVFRRHPAGVAVITADDGTGPAGLTATSVVPVSADPPLLAFSLTSNSATAGHILTAGAAVVHLLGADQAALARRFAASGTDRFADPRTWTRLATGEPLLAAARVWLRCRVTQRLSCGDSTLVVGEVLRAHRSGPVPRPLVYHNRTWYALDEAAVVP